MWCKLRADKEKDEQMWKHQIAAAIRRWWMSEKWSRDRIPVGYVYIIFLLIFLEIDESIFFNGLYQGELFELKSQKSGKEGPNE